MARAPYPLRLSVVLTFACTAGCSDEPTVGPDPVDAGGSIADAGVGDAGATVDAFDPFPDMPHPGSCDGPAEDLGSGTDFHFVFDTTGEEDSAQPSEWCIWSRARANDRVFRYVPPHDGWLYADTDYLGTDMDTVLYVWPSCDGTGAELACANDLNHVRWRASTLVVRAYATEPLYLVVDGALEGERGPVELHVELLPDSSPSSEGSPDCDGAPEVSWSRGVGVDLAVVEGDTAGGTSTSTCVDPMGDDHGTTTGLDHHFRFTLTENRRIRVWADGLTPFWAPEACGATAPDCAYGLGDALFGPISPSTILVAVDPGRVEGAPYRIFVATRPYP